MIQMQHYFKEKPAYDFYKVLSGVQRAGPIVVLEKHIATKIKFKKMLD